MLIRALPGVEAGYSPKGPVNYSKSGLSGDFGLDSLWRKRITWTGNLYPKPFQVNGRLGKQGKFMNATDSFAYRPAQSATAIGKSRLSIKACTELADFVRAHPRSTILDDQGKRVIELDQPGNDSGTAPGVADCVIDKVAYQHTQQRRISRHHALGKTFKFQALVLAKCNWHQFCQDVAANWRKIDWNQGRHRA